MSYRQVLISIYCPQPLQTMFALVSRQDAATLAQSGL
jgi:hypothetical protein